MFRKYLVSTLIICLLFSIVVMGAPTYVNLGPTSYIEGDVGVPAGSGYYISDVLFSTLGLIDISTLAKTDGGIIVGDGTNFVLETGATVRASLGLTIGTHVQAYDAGLLSIAGLTTATNEMIYTTALDAYAVCDLSAFGRSIIDDADESTFKATVNLEIGTDVQAWDTQLDDLATLSYAGNSLKFARVNAGETALEFAAEADPTVDSDAEIKAILVDEVTKTGDFTPGRIAKINNATGIIEMATNTDTEVADAVTKKHAANADTDLDATFEATFVKKADNVNVLNDITSPGADIEDAVTKKHTQNTDTAAGGEWDFGAHSAGFTIQTATGDGTTTINWTLGNYFKFTHGAMSETFTFNPAPTKPSHLTLILIQDGTGGRDSTWPAPVKWLGAEPTWTDGGGGKGIVVAMVYDGTSYWSQGTPWEE